MPAKMDLKESEEANEEIGEELPQEVEEAAPALEQVPTASEELPLEKVLEAALFLANRRLSLQQLSETAGEEPSACLNALQALQKKYEETGSPIEVVLAGDSATMQVKPHYLGKISSLSKATDLSRKSTKILALIAKKGSMLQKDLPQYFRGEIYAYTSELKQKGYVDSRRYKNTRILKPSKRFFEEFRLTGGGGEEK